MSIKAGWYVGIRRDNHKRELFSAIATPTAEDYPQYVCTIGPHGTKRGAIFMRDYGGNNPHVQTTYDADRLAAFYAKR